MSDRVVVTMDSGVADVRLNRPDKRNALDRVMFDALVETSAALGADASVRAVVLSGEGASFCAGLDFASFGEMAERDREGSDREGSDREDSDDEGDGNSSGDISQIAEGRITHHAQQSCYGWTEMPAPVIAAVQGHALGGGIQLALAADMRFVHPAAKMSVLEIRWGIIPDMTGTQSLINLVGLDVAKELTFTGRMVSGVEAGKIGLASRVTEDPLSDALELAHEIAGKNPHAIKAAKRIFNQAAKMSVAEGFAAERAEIGRLIGSKNQAEAVMAFFEKRVGEFVD